VRILNPHQLIQTSLLGGICNLAERSYQPKADNPAIKSLGFVILILIIENDIFNLKISNHEHK